MPPKHRAPPQTLSAHIESSDEGSGGVEVVPKKAPAKRSSKRSAATTITVETAAPAVDKKGKKPTAAAGGRRKKAAVSRVEEPTEDEDVPGSAEEEEGGEDEEDVLEAAPVKGKKKVTTAGGKKATTATAAKKAAAAIEVKSRPKRGAKKVEVEIEEADEEREVTEEEGEVPAPVKKRGGGRKAVPTAAAISVVAVAAPVVEKKKRMTKKEKDAAAAAAKKAEVEEQEKEREIAETQYTPMQLDGNGADGEDDVMEVEATPTQVHSAPAVASKRAVAATGKKAGVSKARGKATKATEPGVVEEGEDDDDLALPAKPPTPVPPKRAGRGAANNGVVVVAAGVGADNETEAYKSLEKAFRELETQHKKLEYVRETEVEQTFTRYKKNAEIKAKEADKLIDSLQTDLNAQARLSGESKALKKKLASKEAELAKLQGKVQELQRGLQEQQNEAKVLSAKLIVAENNSKRGAVAVPGSAVKPKGGIGGGGGMAGAGQAAEEAWIAKVKEELFQDLTGLLVMNVKKEAQKTVFECLQTSSTGVTIHFKLQVPDSLSTTTSSSSSRHQRKPSAPPDLKPAADEDEDESRGEIVYIPLLDQQRDRAVIAVLPEYLKNEISFKKEQLGDFFAKITAFLMGMKTKQVLDSGEGEDDDDDSDDSGGESKGNGGNDGDEEVGDA